MALSLSTRSPNFAQEFADLLGAKRESDDDISESVAQILAQVRHDGDQALAELSLKFDHVDLGKIGLRISGEEISAARQSISAKALAALTLAHDRIKKHHQRQYPKNDQYTDPLGVELGTLWTAVESVGLYVPGGTASYPSSVLMNALPAIVAGVERIAMVVPTPNGQINPHVLAAASICGIDEIYRIGGAQAVGALAYGTATITPVAKIVGPGNAYVATAKRQVFGTVGIDMIAGPSEVLIIADGDANPEWIAADLLAQAEHDVAAQSILMTDSSALAKAVADAVEGQLKTLPRQEIAAASWRDFGAIIVTSSIDEALPLANRFAPEHLELAVADPESLVPKVRNAGSIFLGHYTPEVIGDYVGGSNHVLPTARTARFASGLGVLDFMKRTALLKCDADSLRALGPAAITLAEIEGLDAHARSVAKRLNL